MYYAYISFSFFARHIVYICLFANNHLMDSKLKAALREIFNKHDPIEIYCGKGVNFDEYDPEIKQLPLIFHKNMDLKEFADKLHKLFQKMFSPDIVGNKAKYGKLAKEAYDLLKHSLK